MIKFKMECGHYAYSASAISTFYLGGCGICDDCGIFAERGYLVPVLTHYQCPVCFEDFKSRAKYYPEDVPFEQMVMDSWERRIPVLIDATCNN